jgi:hypothetical protein
MAPMTKAMSSAERRIHSKTLPYIFQSGSMSSTNGNELYGRLEQNLSHKTLTRQRPKGSRTLEKLNLLVPPPRKASHDLSTRTIPLRQLLLSHSIWVLSIVEPADKGGALHGAAAHVERPGNQSAILIGIESNTGNGVAQAYFESLERLSAVRTYIGLSAKKVRHTLTSLASSCSPCASEIGKV